MCKMNNKSSNYIPNTSPPGDQPQAIDALVKGFQEGNQFQTLLGVTGSGKTFTMANVISKTEQAYIWSLLTTKHWQRSLYGELKEFFPENAVEYFVSYYDYYQPEAYVPSTDTYIEKDSAINDEIDKLRHSATAALVRAAGCDHRGLVFPVSMVWAARLIIRI